MQKRGILISIEGIDGSGKSTLLKGLQTYFHDHKLPVVITREPGGTPLGEKLIHLLRTRTVEIQSMAEYLLFATDRAQHFEQVVIPALDKNMTVISDRMADSSLAYQGYGRGLDCAPIQYINAWSMQGREPDITFYLHLSYKEAMQRMQTRTEHCSFEQEKGPFWSKVINGFETIFKSRHTVIRLDASQPPSEVCAQAVAALKSRSIIP